MNPFLYPLHLSAIGQHFLSKGYLALRIAFQPSEELNEINGYWLLVNVYCQLYHRQTLP